MFQGTKILKSFKKKFEKLKKKKNEKYQKSENFDFFDPISYGFFCLFLSLFWRVRGTPLIYF